jgi:uncharacterized membrane protein YqgA involved in biofilm formation
VGVAVKVTEVPMQIVPAGTAAMLTDGITVAVTTMVILFEVAVVGEAQGELDVMITVITSPLLNVVEVKVGELVPAFIPFICH